MEKLLYLLCCTALITTTTSMVSCSGKSHDTTTVISTDTFINLDDIPEANSLLSEDSITFSGKVKTYNQDTTCGCFFVDPEMVHVGAAQALGSKANGEVCMDAKYGKGVPINVSELNPDSDYPNPPEEGVLIIVKGRWKTESYQKKDNITILYITEYEPFF